MLMADGGGIAGGVDAGAIADMMSPIKQAGASGSFTINETGGQALLQAFREMATWIDDNLGKINSLAQQPNLGGTHAAESLKPYMQQVATDEQGFITMLQSFRAALVDAEQGVIDAMNHYRNLDEGAASTYV
jgi:hypothetical protein